MKKSYYSRFQVKQRRRREGKTCYNKRRKLLRQDASRYGVQKARLVVRITNTKVVCQIFRATTMGDKMLAQAHSTELKAYGINSGLTNYTACYLTGLLCGKRVMALFGDNFKCILDIGLRRATKGARVFGALKGCVDANVEIPHDSEKLFGSEEECRDRIFSVASIEYMQKMKQEDKEKFKRVDVENILEIYKCAVEKINEDWERKIKNTGDYKDLKKFRKEKMSRDEKIKIVNEKLEMVRNE